MSQKEKARAIVAEHEFSFRTKANVEEIFDVFEHAAKAAAPGGLQGTFVCTGRTTGRRAVSQWEFRGPGGFVQVMTFTITAEDAGTERVVSLHVGKFMYVKGAMFTKPSLNGSKQLSKLHRTAVEQLSAGATASP